MIEVTHKLHLTAKCPVDDRLDVYQAEVRVRRVLPVEEILAAVAEIAEMRAYQEDITETLANRLDAEVSTFGSHSGVLVEVRAWPNPED